MTGVHDDHWDDPDTPESMARTGYWPAPADPMTVARRIAELIHTLDATVTLRRWRGQWVAWHESGAWVDVEDAAVRKDIYSLLEGAKYLDDKSNPKQWQPSRRKVADLLEALDAICHLPGSVNSPTWLDGAQGPRAGEIVACANGLLHVTTRDLRPHDPRFFTRVAVPFPYDPAAIEPARWMRFLEDLWPDDPAAIKALQEVMGYVLSGRTDLHKILLLIGPTRAGKGVIARVLKALIGAGNVAGPTLSSLATNFGLSPLIGKPLAIVSDARLGGSNVHQTVERLLSISGEDLLTIDRKYLEPWTGKLPTRFVIISNELPNFGDASGAIARRFVVLTMSKSFLGKENIALTDELLTELPGILRWSLDGLDRLTRQGRFTEPQSSADAIVALQDIVSPCSAFVRDLCTVGPAREVPCDALYDAWKVWAEANGHKAGTVQRFGRNLRAVIPGLTAYQPTEDGEQRRRWYRGISLRKTHSGDQRVSTSVTSNGEAHKREDTRTNPLSVQHDDAPISTLQLVEIQPAPCRICNTTSVFADGLGPIHPTCQENTP